MNEEEQIGEKTSHSFEHMTDKIGLGDSAYLFGTLMNHGKEHSTFILLSEGFHVQRHLALLISKVESTRELSQGLG